MNIAGSQNIGGKRILLISNEVKHYRVSIYNYFFRRFRDYGYEFMVLANKCEKVNRNAIEFEMIEEPFSFSAYKRIIHECHPEVVIVFLRLKDWIIWPLIHWLKYRRIPFAIWTKGGNWDLVESRWRFHVFNYVHGRSDALILYSKACQEYLRPQFRAKAFVANNTINFEDFPSIPQSKESIKQELGIPFEKVVLFVGRMGVEKGRKRVDHLIEVFRGLDRKGIGLILVGSGLRTELKDRINTANTVYLGEIHDDRNIGISKVFNIADLCVIPGHVGLGINQAFYWGLPVITEEDRHPPEIAYLRPGQNGFMIPRNDLQSLRERMLYLLDHDDVRTEFSRKAREVILTEGSTEQMFSGFRDCVLYLARS